MILGYNVDYVLLKMESDYSRVAEFNKHKLNPFYICVFLFKSISDFYPDSNVYKTSYRMDASVFSRLIYNLRLLFPHFLFLI